MGVVIGPYGLAYISDPTLLTDISEFGIIFLLFLLGLDMQPAKLLVTLKKTFLVTIASALIFMLIGFSTGLIFAFSTTESLVIGFSMIFSSTIIGLKLLPTTVLHHQHTGELMISVLLMQDIIAIVVLLFVQGAADTSVSSWIALAKVVAAFPLLIGVAYVFQRFVLVKLL